MEGTICIFLNLYEIVYFIYLYLCRWNPEGISYCFIINIKKGAQWASGPFPMVHLSHFESWLLMGFLFLFLLTYHCSVDQRAAACIFSLSFLNLCCSMCNFRKLYPSVSKEMSTFCWWGVHALWEWCVCFPGSTFISLVAGLCSFSCKWGVKGTGPYLSIEHLKIPSPLP